MIPNWVLTSFVALAGLALLLLLMRKLRKEKKSFSTDRLVGISAIIISLCTLVIFVYQTNIIREQSRLSVRPRISFTSSQNQKDSLIQFRHIMSNKGLGPAIIDSMALIYKGEYYELDMGEFLEEQLPKIKKYGRLLQSTSYVKGTTLRPGEQSIYYTFAAFPSTIEELAEYLEVDKEQDDPFDFMVIYTSIYEEKYWQLNTLEGPEPVLLENYKHE